MTTQNTTTTAIVSTNAALSEEEIFGTSADIQHTPALDELELAAEVEHKVAEARHIYESGFVVDTTTGEQLTQEEVPPVVTPAPAPVPTPHQAKKAGAAHAKRNTTLTVSRMSPSDKRYPVPVKFHGGESAPTFWFVGNAKLLESTGVGLVLGERPNLEKQGDSGYTNAKAVIRKLAPSRVLVLGNKYTPVTEWDTESRTRHFVRHGADVYMASWITQVPEYKGVILVLGTSLTQEIVDQYKEALQAGKMLIITFIDPEAFDQKGSLMTSMHRSAFIASHCQDVIVIEVSDINSGSWNTTTLTKAFGHRLHVIQSPNMYAGALNKIVLDHFKGHALVKLGDLSQSVR